MILQLIRYGVSASAGLAKAMIIFRPNSPEMLTSVLGLNESESCEFVLKIINIIMGTAVSIWVAVAAEKGVILLASLYVATVFWTKRCLVTIR